MQSVLIMSLSGSLLFGAYCLLKRIGGEQFELYYRNFLLKAILFFYLLPPASLAVVYRDVIGGIMSLFPILGSGKTGQVIEMKYILNKTQDGYFPNRNLEIAMYWMLAWLVVASIVLLVGVIRAVSQIKKMKGCSHLLENAQFQRLQEEYGIRGKVRIYGYPVELSPFTVGVFKPMIFVYAEADEKEKELILRHELSHIKRGDVFVKQLASLATYVHWFNPLVRWFKRELEAVAELSSDRMVLEHAEKDIRREYAGVVLEYARNVPQIATAYGMSQNSKTLKERLECIMKQSEKKSWNRALTGILLGGLILINSFTVLAGPEINIIESNRPGESVYYEGETWFIPDGAEPVFEEEIIEVVYDIQFTDEQGNVYPVESDTDVDPAIFCIHSYETGIGQRHIVNTDGSCVIKRYEGKRCTKCGKTKDEILISTYTYDPCPH